MENKPNYACVTTSDVDQLAEIVQPWDVIITQLSAGSFSGSCDIVELNGLIAYRERWSHRVHALGVSPPGYFMLGYADNATWCGRSLEPGVVAVSTHGPELDFITPDASDQVVVLIPQDRIECLICDEHGSALPTHHLLTCSERLHQLFTGVVRNLLSQGNLLDNAHTAAAFETELMYTVRRCIGIPDAYGNGPQASSCWKIVLRALDCLDNSVSRLNIEQLARATCVSQRSLEYAFNKVMGISPLKFHRAQRLMGAHKDLCRSEPDISTTVTSIAGSWGFTELGRFSVQYRELFGEKPSQTLLRSRQGPHQRLADILVNRPHVHTVERTPDILSAAQF